jgi:hypothetical protein
MSMMCAWLKVDLYSGLHSPVFNTSRHKLTEL